ncbi:MAG: hypothetical protein KGK07_17685 [Chloroflexota bacterium]|nr:hypothetical protein [Chloroflexota bacterium]
MGKAARAKQARRDTLATLSRLAFAGDAAAFTIANSWHVLPVADRDAAMTHYEARRRVLAYRAAGTPYGDHATGYTRWREAQGILEDAGVLPDWDVAAVFDQADAAVHAQNRGKHG